MTVVIIVCLYLMAGWLLLGILGAPFLIGKPRKPMTAGAALASMIFGSALFAAVVALALAFANP